MELTEFYYEAWAASFDPHAAITHLIWLYGNTDSDVTFTMHNRLLSTAWEH